MRIGGDEEAMLIASFFCDDAELQRGPPKGTPEAKMKREVGEWLRKLEDADNVGRSGGSLSRTLRGLPAPETVRKSQPPMGRLGSVTNVARLPMVQAWTSGENAAPSSSGSTSSLSTPTKKAPVAPRRPAKLPVDKSEVIYILDSDEEVLVIDSDDSDDEVTIVEPPAAVVPPSSAGLLAPRGRITRPATPPLLPSKRPALSSPSPSPRPSKIAKPHRDYIPHLPPRFPPTCLEESIAIATSPIPRPRPEPYHTFFWSIFPRQRSTPRSGRPRSTTSR